MQVNASKRTPGDTDSPSTGTPSCDAEPTDRLSLTSLLCIKRLQSLTTIHTTKNKILILLQV